MASRCSVVSRRDPDGFSDIIDVSAILKRLKRCFCVGSVKTLISSYHSDGLVSRKLFAGLAGPTDCVGQQLKRVLNERRYPPPFIHTSVFQPSIHEPVSVVVLTIHRDARCPLLRRSLV